MATISGANNAQTGETFMNRKTTLIVIGMLLLGLSTAWFLTPLREVILSALQPPASGERGVESLPGALDMLNTTLNALNALFGAVGAYLAVRGYRLQPPVH